MSSIVELVLSGCSKVKKLPEFGESMEHLSVLSLERTSITKLPPSLGCLVGLTVLSLKDCNNLVCLPSTIDNLKFLKILNISGCSKVSRLPEGLKEIKFLEHLDANGTAIEELPSSIFYLENLEALSFSECKGLVSKSSNLLLPFGWLFGSRPVPRSFKIPPFVSCLPSLLHLDLSYCNLSEGSIPNDFGSLSSLRRLNLTGNNFVSLPSTISKLTKLKYLFLDYCRSLQLLPELPSAIELLYASNCTALETSRFDPSKPCNLLALTKKFHFPGNDTGAMDPLIAIQRLLQEVQTSKPRFEMLIPGNEIPSWFDHQNSRFFVTVQLHQNWPSTEWVGFALCFVLVDYGECHHDHDFFCYYKECGSGNAPCPIFCGYVRDMEPYQPHLYIVYLSGDQIEASQCGKIKFSLKSECYYGLEVTKCGCRLVYKEDLEDWKKTGKYPFQWRIWATNEIL